MKRIILTAPNFSEGRDQEKIQKILDCFRNREHVQILRWQGDPDHNRFGANVIGEPEAIYEAMLEAIGTALELIDMTKHHGQHPRMGAVDVIPLTPLRNCTIEDCSELAHKIASEAADKYHLPFFLYEKSANTPARTNLAEIRKGEFEGMAEKLKSPEWKPDYGPDTIHPTGGVTAIGARDFMIALNVNLGTTDLSIAKEIAKRVRFSSGGFRYVKAIGVEMKGRNLVQVSMDLTNYKKTSVCTVIECIRALTLKHGIPIVSCQIGMLSLDMLIEIAREYLNLESLFEGPFSADQIFETYLL